MTVSWWTAEGGTAGADVATTAVSPSPAFFAITKGTGATIKFQSAAAAHGSMGYQIVNVTAGQNSYLAAAGATATAAVSAAVNFTALALLSTGSSNLISLYANAGTRAARVDYDSSGSILILNSAAAQIYTSATDSFALTNGSDYRVELRATQGASTTTGEIRVAVFAKDGSTALWSKTLTGVNSGTSTIQVARIGSVAGAAGTWNADDIRVDDAGGWPVGPAVTDTVNAGADQSGVEPWDTVTLTASSSSGSATWSQVSGTTQTLAGSGALVRTFIPTRSLSAQTLVFRATNGSATDDVTVSVLPATDAILTSGGLVPVRLVRKTA